METTLDENKLNEEIPERARDIEGWGIDADPENDPSYPMKHYTGADHQRLKYDRAPQQPANIEVLHSNERPDLTRVFGVGPAPSGLSGVVRRYAFRFSEGSAGHWMTLLLADRINVAEGIVDDLRRGYIPNFFAERGWKAEWSLNRKGVVTRLAIGVALASAVLLLATRRRVRINAAGD